MHEERSGTRGEGNERTLARRRREEKKKAHLRLDEGELARGFAFSSRCYSTRSSKLEEAGGLLSE